MHINIRKIRMLTVFCLFLIITLLSISVVYANHSSGGEGDNNYSKCTYDYCYQGSSGNGHGIRLSLYEYKNRQITYYESVDFCTGGGCFDGEKAITTSNMAGRIAYQYGKSRLSFGKESKLEPNTKTRFNCYNGDGCHYQNGVDEQINKLFNLGTDSYEKVRTAIQNVFGYYIEDLTYTYITVEPTIYFYKKGGSPAYYGTVYELIKSWNSNIYGMKRVIYTDTPNAIKAEYTIGNDDNCFIGTPNCSSSLISLVKEEDANANDIITGIGSNKGYGINVIWVGSSENVPPLKKTCQQFCSGQEGDGLLQCAENWCQNDANVKNSEGKKSCLIGCGYSDPGFSSCTNSNTINGKDTICDEDTTARTTTCTVANNTNYYKTECIETTTIEYGNSLPVTLLPGSGFTYTPVVKGNKTCTMTFEVDKWKFDYAASYTTNERSTLVKKLDPFNDVSKDSIWAKDVNDIYKYESNDADIKIEITNNNDAGASNNKTTKKLIADETINLLDEEVKVSSGGTTNVAMFNGGKKTRGIYSAVKTDSSNKTSYKLPGICMNAGSGTLYELRNGLCDSSNDGPYYEYFTSLKAKKDRYPTSTKVIKKSSGLAVTNTCEYNVDLPVSCAVIKNKNIYELRIENKNGVTGIQYGLSLNKNELNNKDTYTGSLENKQLYGTVAINGKIIATCKASDNSNCNEKYKPSQYSEIRDYCSEFWMVDEANYSSEKDCVSSCSTGSNTCKNNPNVDTNNIESVTDFCSDKTNRDNNGYNAIVYASPELNEEYNIAMCINDCINLPKDNECLGITCDYLYRPISLKDPFPNNRRPGYNWYGKEIFITDDLLNPLLNSNGANPEYVISLNPDRIDAINRNTDNYNSNKDKNAYIDYVYNDNNTSGKYISKFIHYNDESNGGFKNYFTMIESVSN